MFHYKVLLVFDNLPNHIILFYWNKPRALQLHLWSISFHRFLIKIVWKWTLYNSLLLQLIRIGFAKSTWHCLNIHASTILYLPTSTRIPFGRCVKISWVIMYLVEKICLTQRMLTNSTPINIFICFRLIVFVHL